MYIVFVVYLCDVDGLCVSSVEYNTPSLTLVFLYPLSPRSPVL